MKQVAIIASLFISASSFAQKVEKKDTAYVPLFEVTKALPAHLLYVSDNNAVMYGEGYAVVKGFMKADSTWAAQPKIIGYLDQKKKPKSKVIQAF